MKEYFIKFFDWIHDILEKVFGNWAEFKAILVIWIVSIVILLYFSGYKDNINKENSVSNPRNSYICSNKFKNNSNMKVIDTRVLIQVKKQKSTQKIGPIEVAVDNKEYELATVIEVGENVNKEVLNSGMDIYIYPGAGKRFFHEGQEYRVIAYNEIIVIL